MSSLSNFNSLSKLNGTLVDGVCEELGELEDGGVEVVNERPLDEAQWRSLFPQRVRLRRRRRVRCEQSAQLLQLVLQPADLLAQDFLCMNISI